MIKRVIENIRSILNQPIKNKHLSFGAPFFIFMSLGLLILSQCGTIRYDFRKVRVLDREELKKLGINVKDKPTTLEEHFEKYHEKVDIDNWENIRIPRYWEEESKK